jgi:uncharacterized protein (DUF4213/DUF364 family)
MVNTIQKRIINYLKPISKGLTSTDVRIGLGYTSVRLSNGNIGLAWTAESTAESCTHEMQAGTLTGRTALDLLEMLASEIDPLSRSVGLASANALFAVR